MHKVTLFRKGIVNLRQHYPRPGWVEHDPNEIWDVTQNTIVDVLHQSKIKSSISVIGITNQRETTVVWDRETGKTDSSSNCMAVPPHDATSVLNSTHKKI